MSPFPSDDPLATLPYTQNAEIHRKPSTRRTFTRSSCTHVYWPSSFNPNPINALLYKGGGGGGDKPKEFNKTRELYCFFTLAYNTPQNVYWYDSVCNTLLCITYIHINIIYMGKTVNTTTRHNISFVNTRIDSCFVLYFSSFITDNMFSQANHVLESFGLSIYVYNPMVKIIIYCLVLTQITLQLLCNSPASFSPKRYIYVVLTRIWINRMS